MIKLFLLIIFINAIRRYGKLNFNTVSVLGVGDSVTITSIADKYWVSDHVRKEALDAETLVYSLLFVAQMVAYWLLYDDVISKRDDALDKEMAFLEQLQAWKEQDLPMLYAKRDLLGLPVPSANVCGYATMYASDGVADGVATDAMLDRLIESSPRRLPTGWSNRDGNLAAAKAIAAGGNIMSTTGQRRHDKFVFDKAQVVIHAQHGMKTTYTAEGVLGLYNTASSIYGGLAGIWIQGFNSAGAGLGTILQRSLGTKSGVTTPGTIQDNGMGQESSMVATNPKAAGAMVNM